MCLPRDRCAAGQGLQRKGYLMLTAYIITVVLYFITAFVFVSMTTRKGGIVTVAETVVGFIIGFIPVINVFVMLPMGSEVVDEYGPRPMFGKKDVQDNVVTVDFKKKNQE